MASDDDDDASSPFVFKPKRIVSAQAKLARSMSRSIVQSRSTDNIPADDEDGIEKSTSWPGLNLLDEPVTDADASSSSSSSSASPSYSVSSPSLSTGSAAFSPPPLDLCFSRANMSPELQTERAGAVLVKRLLARARLKFSRLLADNDFLVAGQVLLMLQRAGKMPEDAMVVADACSSSTLLPLVSALLQRQLTSALSAQTLFRDESPALFLIKGCLLRHGSLFLQALFSRSFDGFHAAFARSKEPLESSATKLRQLVLGVDYLIASIDLVPPLFAAVFAAVFRRLSALGLDASREDLARQVVASTLLLHFLCPRLVAMRPVKPKRGSDRAAPYGTLVAKYLLQIANRSLDADREPGASLKHLLPTTAQKCCRLIANGEQLLDNPDALRATLAGRSAVADSSLASAKLLHFLKSSNNFGALIEFVQHTPGIDPAPVLNDLAELQTIINSTIEPADSSSSSTDIHSA